MRIIEYYILRQVVVLFFAVLVAAVGITWTVQLLGRINFLTTSGQTFFTLLHFSLLVIPSTIPLVLPFALVIAITQTLSKMNQDSELVIINASGASRAVIWRPLVIFGLLISIVSFMIANFVTPYARLQMRDLMASVRSDLISVVLTENSFHELSPDIRIQIGTRNADGSVGQIFIVDEREPGITNLYAAVKGLVVKSGQDHFLVMNDGDIQRTDHDSGDINIIHFSSNRFNLSTLTGEDQEPTIYPKDQTLEYLLNPDPDDAYFQHHSQQYTAELHRRLTEWLYPLVFTLIALSIAADAHSHRQARISTSFTAISLSLFIYWLGYFFGDRADSDIAFIPLLYIPPLVMMILIGFLYFTNRSLALQENSQMWLAEKAEKIRRLFVRKGSHT